MEVYAQRQTNQGLLIHIPFTPQLLCMSAITADASFRLPSRSLYPSSSPKGFYVEATPYPISSTNLN